MSADRESALSVQIGLDILHAVEFLTSVETNLNAEASEIVAKAIGSLEGAAKLIAEGRVMARVYAERRDAVVGAINGRQLTGFVIKNSCQPAAGEVH